MSTRKSLAWMVSAQASSFFLQFFASVVLARYLTPYETGIYAAALATAGVLSLVQAFGLQALIVRVEALTNDLSNTAFTINALISIALSAAIAATSFGAGAFLGDTGVRTALLVLAANPLFGIFSFLPSATLERNSRFKEIALVGVAAALVGAAATIVMAVNGFSYMSVAYAQAASGAVNAILMNVVGRQHVRFQFGLKAWRQIGEFGLQMLAVSGVSAVSTRLSDVILGRILGLSALGVYSRATGLNGLIWNNIHIVISRVMLVDYSGLHRRGIPLRHRYLRTVEVATATLWPAFTGLALLAKPSIMIVYGAQWVPAAYPLVFLAIASIIQVAISMTWELFAATGELRTQTRIEFVRATLSLFFFIGGCLISLEAAAAARVLDAILAVFLYRQHLNRMTGTFLSDFWLIYLRSAMLTVLAVTPAGILMAAFRMSADISVLLLLSVVGLGILLWGLGLFLLRHPLADELKRAFGI